MNYLAIRGNGPVSRRLVVNNDPASVSAVIGCLFLVLFHTVHTLTTTLVA